MHHRHAIVDELLQGRDADFQVVVAAGLVDFLPAFSTLHGLGRAELVGSECSASRQQGPHPNCNNPLCYNGGFRVGNEIRDMGSWRETQRKGSTTCQANEESPQGRRAYRKHAKYSNGMVAVRPSGICLKRLRSANRGPPGLRGGACRGSPPARSRSRAECCAFPVRR